MDEFIDAVTNQGFAIAVAIYLLYERGRFNQAIVVTMKEISIAMKSIETEIRGSR